MNRLSYYDRSKAPWDETEAIQLKQKYNRELFTITQCANIHKRTPGCIAYKLKSLGIIPHICLSRGYTEYVTSPLYNEIVTQPKKLKKKKVSKTSPTQKAIIECTNKLNVIGEIESMKSDIAELKRDVKEILRLMHAIYEFQETE